jgi:GAF domain-containing protein
VMSSYLDYGTSLSALVELMVPAVADVCFFDEVAEGDSLRLRAWKHVDAVTDEWIGENLASGVTRSGDDAAARLLREGGPELVPEVNEAWIEAVATSHEHRHFLRELRLRSLMRIPVFEGDHLVGVLTLARTSEDRSYTDADLNLGTSICDRLTATLRNARLYAELQQAVRMRDEVTSIVSHDLRSPVHTVRMASSLLLDAAETLDLPTRRKNLR